MKRLRKFSVLGICVLVMFGLSVQTIHALPTFARKFQTSCSTCHTSVPKLTAFGESFRLNGYQIPEGDEKYLKEKPTSLGAPPWKEVWPQAIWPGAIPGSFPLSAWVLSDANSPIEGEDKEVEFEFPHEVELFMAGVMGEDVPFFLEVEWEEGEVGAEAWMGFYNLFRSNRGLNLRVGSFEINPLPMAFDHLRLGKEHYLYNNWRVPGSSNRFRLRGGKPGLELNGIVASRLFYSAGVVSPEGGIDGYGTLRYKIGGTPYDRSAPTEAAVDEAVSAVPTGFWVDNAFELAGFAYFGEDEVGDDVSDTFRQVGVGARWAYQNLDFSAAYVIGKNNDPYGDGREVESDAWHVEGTYFIYPWLIAEARYEELRVDQVNGNSQRLIEQKNKVLGLIWMLRANIKLITEVTLFDNKTDMFSVRLAFGF